MSLQFFCGTYHLFLLVIAIFGSFSRIACIFNRSTSAIVTVFDLGNTEVARDAMTLIRSIRHFGGTVKDIDIVVYIVNPSNDDQNLPNELDMLEFSEYRVFVYTMIRPTMSFAPTMNKLFALSFVDTSKYESVLWLDADTIVWDDISELFDQHHQGTIGCVPEIYSYMRRYPKINQTMVYPNANLQPFTHPIENETSPHGTCNTGMILFDRDSLLLFLEGMKSQELIEIIRPHSQDRFIDSLIFVLIVNRLGIEVIPVSYSMNYMAFFDGELIELGIVDVKIAHFLSNTAFYCTYEHVNGSSQKCQCFYEYPTTNINSPLVRKMEEIEQKSNGTLCQLLARGNSYESLNGLNEL